MEPQRILVVCLGNICRSPMAHGIFESLIEASGQPLRVDSAGVAGYHAGERPDPRTLEVLSRHGIALDTRSRKVELADFQQFDLILAMDQSNHAALTKMAPQSERHKIRLMLEPTTGGEVSDPYYGTADGFEKNYREIREAAAVWLQLFSDATLA